MIFEVFLIVSQPVCHTRRRDDPHNPGVKTHAEPRLWLGPLRPDAPKGLAPLRSPRQLRQNNPTTMELSSNAMITKPNPRKQRKPPLSQEQQKEQRPRLLAWQQQHYHSSPSCLLLLLTQKTKNPKGGPRVFPFAHPNLRGDSNPPSMIDNSKIITQLIKSIKDVVD